MPECVACGKEAYRYLRCRRCGRVLHNRPPCSENGVCADRSECEQVYANNFEMQATVEEAERAFAADTHILTKVSKCPDCGSGAVVTAEGYTKCSSCGWHVTEGAEV